MVVLCPGPGRVGLGCRRPLYRGRTARRPPAGTEQSRRSKSNGGQGLQPLTAGRPRNTRRAYCGALGRLGAWLAGRRHEDATLAAYLAAYLAELRARGSSAGRAPRRQWPASRPASSGSLSVVTRERPRRRPSGSAPTRWSTRNAGSKPASPSGSRPGFGADLEHLLEETVDARRDAVRLAVVDFIGRQCPVRRRVDEHHGCGELVAPGVPRPRDRRGCSFTTPPEPEQGVAPVRT